MTEIQLRKSVVSAMTAWLGYNETNGKYKEIIDIYNSHKPLARSYAVQYNDEWCATAVSAAFVKAGLTDIAPTECSCPKMLTLYKNMGCWVEDDAYVPQLGDLVMYYWKDDGKGDCTGSPNHVGLVAGVSGKTITVIEGNKGEAVAYRTLEVNGEYIRGYCTPDYASKATNRKSRYHEAGDIRITEVPVEQFKILLYDARKKSMGKNRCNAGYFGKWGKTKYTLPSGHVVCDYIADAPETRASCEERGRFEGDKFTFEAGTWSYMNEFYGKSVSTLLVSGGKAQVNDLTVLPAGLDYAIAGLPVVRHGEDCKLTAYVKAQGWSGSNLGPTRHIFVGLKEASADTVYVMEMQTKTSNMVKKSEAYKIFKALGFFDVLKLDGGGSLYYNAAGKTTATLENRRVCTIIDWGELDNPYPIPTRTLYKGRKGEDVKWLQTELNRYYGCSCAVDGSFGSGTERALRVYQTGAGLQVDGRCGKATRASLLK